MAWSELTRIRTSRLRSVAATPSWRRADDLLELFHGVEAEGPDAMHEIGLGDRFLGLHRVHEAQYRLGSVSCDQPHLGDRGDVIMGDAAVPEDASRSGEGLAFTA